MINPKALREFLSKKSIPAYRSKQIMHAVYKEAKDDFQKIVILPKNVRDLLIANLKVFCFEVEREVESKSGDTTKTLFKLKDGSLIEGVLMHFKDGRNSVCVSSQVGCPLKCAFCATGARGFTRNLTAEEIADQVLYFNHKLKKRVTHVVFMGMGEPLLNYENVMEAISVLNDEDLFGIAARHITVSTAGIIPGIEKLMQAKIQINLALSLHAPNQTLREKLMPIANSYKLPDLMKAVLSYLNATRRRISYEYVMLKGINDSASHAEELSKLLRGQLCHVNLIPYNETYLGFSNAGRPQIETFRKILEKHKVPVTIRVSLGQDISAACGQLGRAKAR
ncbi:MAG: 23S rRNA (adenine(2503)-C(2))-methyltransferase RlmN [Patescibacteria group bacterium]